MDALFDGLSSPYVDLSAVVDQNGEVSAYDAHRKTLPSSVHGKQARS